MDLDDDEPVKPSHGPPTHKVTPEELAIIKANTGAGIYDCRDCGGMSFTAEKCPKCGSSRLSPVRPPPPRPAALNWGPQEPRAVKDAANAGRVSS
jgi:ribosomal protein L40E